MGKTKNRYEQAAEDVQSKAKMKCRMVYGADGPFDVYAVRLDPPQKGESLRVRILITYPTARAFEDGTVRRIPWTNDQLTDYLQPTLRLVRRTYVGQWCLEFRNHLAEPSMLDRAHGSRLEAERQILAGPDTPGRRWLLRRQGQQGERQQISAALAETVRTVPASELPRMATRQDLDALVDRLKAQPAPARGRPNEIDWTSDNLDPPRHREPGEDDEG